MMLKNKEIRKLICLELIILFIGILLVSINNRRLIKSYKEEIIDNNAYIMNTLIEKYPEDEDLIVDALINHDIGIEQSREILEKYGLDDIDSVDYLSHNIEIKNNYIKQSIINMSVIIVIMFTIFIIFIFSNNL